MLQLHTPAMLPHQPHHQVVGSRLWRYLSGLLHVGGVPEPVGSAASEEYQQHMQQKMAKVREAHVAVCGSKATDRLQDCMITSRLDMRWESLQGDCQLLPCPAGAPLRPPCTCVV